MLPVANSNNQLDIGIGIGYLHIGNNSAPPPLIATHAPAAPVPRSARVLPAISCKE